MKFNVPCTSLLTAGALIYVANAGAGPPSTAFTYQGQLTEAGRRQGVVTSKCCSNEQSGQVPSQLSGTKTAR